MSRMNKIGKTATAVYAQGMEMVVRYHDTDIVRFDDKRIVLNSGGWRTRTTKVRMNQAANVFDLGFMVVQKHGQWQVLVGGKTLDFSDGMEIARKIPTGVN